MLNDGIARATLEAVRDPTVLSYWLRSCIWTHCGILQDDVASGHPGPRSVIAAGPSAVYAHEGLTLDDFVYNYSKAAPDKPGALAQKGVDPVIVSNPLPLQLNLAFSKAYILDQGGSAWGLSGPGIFIDHSVLDFVREVAAAHTLTTAIIDRDCGSHHLFALTMDPNETRYFLGFQLASEPITISQKQISTTLYRLLAFHPCDEDVQDFLIPVC
jgi:hypothetical protein